MQIARMTLLAAAVLAAWSSGTGQPSQSVSSTLPAQGSKPAISLNLSIFPDVLKAGTPIDPVFVITNNSDHEITLFTDFVEGFPNNVGVFVHDSNGGVPSRTEFVEDARRGYKMHKGPAERNIPNEIPLTRNSAYFSLKAGESVVNSIEVTKLYDLSKPGKYTIQVGRSDPESKTEVKSNTTTVTVTDPTQPIRYPYGTQTPFVLLIRTLKETVKVGSEIQVDSYLLNNSNHEIHFDPVTTMNDIEVRDSEGNLAPVTEGGRETREQFGRGSGRSTDVPPGELEPAGGIMVSKIYNMTRPGKYTIQVSRVDEETKAVVKSNTLTLTVVP